jgi:diguanylate cyclase (GGDEF)-like protein
MWEYGDSGVVTVSRTQLNSPFAEQRQHGFRWLKFSPFVEEEFRQSYSRGTAGRARLLIGLAVAALLVLIGSKLSQPGPPGMMVAFEVLITLPILLGTLYFSLVPARHRVYLWMLAASLLLLGLMINSVVTRASMQGMPYYFAATVAWLFVVWLICGLPFRAAALTAALISSTYLWGMQHWNFEPSERYFGTATLAFVNLMGAFCCYQLEHALRRSFLESKVLSQLAERDGLTGLYNRRSYDQHLERLWRQSRREHSQLTLMLIDIDNFKDYNDLYGHQAGDDALKKVAEVIRQAAHRPLDIVARFGGEEFALVLYGPDTSYSRELPEQLRESVLALKVPHQGSMTGPYLSVSIGVANVMPDADRSLEGAVQMADEALYQAKEEGRDRVVVRDSPNTTVQTGRFRVKRRFTA